jgi:hypothetical protein
MNRNIYYKTAQKVVVGAFILVFLVCFAAVCFLQSACDEVVVTCVSVSETPFKAVYEYDYDGIRHVYTLSRYEFDENHTASDIGDTVQMWVHPNTPENVQATPYVPNNTMLFAGFVGLVVLFVVIFIMEIYKRIRK